MSKRIVAADLFCGAGGTSTGLSLACESAGRRLDLTAVNHNETAIATHSTNHPNARHLCHGLDEVDPRKVFGRRNLNLLVASPECTHHSTARGGKPMEDQSRSTAWHVIRWTDALRPEFVLVENVREFQTWGPLGTNSRPLKRRKGETFAAWVNALRSLGYTVDWRLLNAADYGDATSRIRLFVLARRGKGKLPWPEPTHAKEATADLFGSRPRWRAAREVIDWSLPCPSIFGRKRPLSANTLKRIEAGLRRFGGPAAGPFLLALTHGGRERSAHDPLPTLTASRELGVVQPFVMQMSQSGSNGDRMRDVEAPYPTITTADDLGIVQPFILDQHSSHGPRSADDPAPTITTTSRGIGVVQPFLVPYYGTGESDDTADPLRTLTARDRLGLVQPDGVRVDIGFRMLQPHELAAAMGFPASYQFCGNREQRVKQIGNAVPVNLSYSLTRAILEAA